MPAVAPRREDRTEPDRFDALKTVCCSDRSKRPATLLNRSRALYRFGIDGCWYAYCDDFNDGKGWWEATPGTPEWTVLVVQGLHGDLRLTWRDACEAVGLLARHPEDPKVFAPETQGEQAATP